jgi:TolC family type I secretion outer membrane protein
MYKIISNLASVFVLIFCLSVNSYGNDLSSKATNTPVDSTLHSLLENVLQTHEDIKNFESQVEKAHAQHRKTRGLYYPTLDLRADGGRERTDREFGSDTVMNRYDASLRANQLITDFGKTQNMIDRSMVLIEQAEARLASKRQQVLREGILAYINLVKARDRLKSAQKSENRIKELTGIEKTLVEKKAGLSSDLLQAKSQLAGAMALRVQAEGDLSIAKNRFQAVFFYTPDSSETDQLADIPFPHNKLPVTLEDAVILAQKQNPELLITFYDTQLAQKDIDIAQTAFYPQLNLFADARKTDNDDGIEGYKNQLSAGLEFRYNLFRGGADQAELTSALANKQAASYYTRYVQRIIREQVGNSWEQLSIFKHRAELLKQQADIVENFLLLAKKERKMGTRSLLDVLNGEVNHINASAAAIVANQDTKIAAFNLFFAMGNMGLDLLE